MTPFDDSRLGRIAMPDALGLYVVTKSYRQSKHFVLTFPLRCPASRVILSRAKLPSGIEGHAILCHE